VAWLGCRLRELLPDLKPVGFLPLGPEADSVQTLSVKPGRTAILDKSLHATMKRCRVSAQSLHRCTIALQYKLGRVAAMMQRRNETGAPAGPLNHRGVPSSLIVIGRFIQGV
jgi:hypothetical protein